MRPSGQVQSPDCGASAPIFWLPVEPLRVLTVKVRESPERVSTVAQTQGSCKKSCSDPSPLCSCEAKAFISVENGTRTSALQAGENLA